nr:hypothetical protein BaRGS_028213 [Batillaria attramentaria]
MLEHGTRCAGEVAAQADNHVCSVGVAYNARIGGVRMLDGDVTDSVEAQSLGLRPDHIHIYSASWGPDDDGRTVDGPATLARKAFYDGNGGRDGDNCNCDGYTNSIYTLSISSSTENGNVPCPSMTWRDMQHIVVETAKPDNLNADHWTINGVGKKVSHSFGFGLMDASAMVAMARNWTTVPPQHICEIRSLDHNRIVPQNGKIIVPLYTDGCEGTVNHVKYLEHVQARITMTSTRRGEIQIFLTSPSLTRSTLLAKRTRDTSREGFNNWAFMTTHNWGEPAKGQWALEIENGASSCEYRSAHTTRSVSSAVLYWFGWLILLYY